MDLPFSSGIGAGIFTQQTVAGTKGTATISDSRSDSANNGDAVKQFLEEAKSFSASSERAGRYLTLSNVKNAIDVAASAVSEIADLNSQKAALALEASDLATGSKTQQLADEAQKIENRIQDIYSTASFNGKTLLNTNSVGYSTNVSSADLQDAIVVPGLATFFTASSPTAASNATTFSTQQNALTHYNNLSTRGQGLNTVLGNYESAQGKANTLLETTLVGASQDPDVLTNPDDAQKLATDIATQIGSQFSSEETTQQLIDATIGSNPDTKKIADLLAS